MNRRTVHRGEAMLAYAAVATAFGMTFSLEQLNEMAELSKCLEDVLGATKAMREVFAYTDDPTAESVANAGVRMLKQRGQAA